MRLLPWTYFKTWNCLLCGDCCRKYMVPLSRNEIIWVSENFGRDKIVKRGGKYFLARRSDGSCIFLFQNKCMIQENKPLACKLWPFYIYSKPLKYSDERKALFFYKEKKYFVYVDAFCRGLNKGFIPLENVIREVIGLYEGEQRGQLLTTGSVNKVVKIINTEPSLILLKNVNR